MKYIIIFLSILLFSCTATKSQSGQFDDSRLSDMERNVVNDFLDFELQKSDYKSYKNFNYFVIREAFPKMKPLSVYEFNLKNKNSWGKSIRNWILDSSDIISLKRRFEREAPYYWTNADFSEIKAVIISNSEFIASTSSDGFMTEPNRLIMRLSRPLLLDKEIALLSFDIGNGNTGYGQINHFTVLMRNINGTWHQEEYFEDGIYH